jgi:uncharacterized protein
MTSKTPKSGSAAPLPALFEASVPAFIRGLQQLLVVLGRAEAHAQENGLDLEAFLDFKLSPDMLPLSTQVEIATNLTLRGGWPLMGRAVPPFGPPTRRFADLAQRINATITELQALDASCFAGAEARIISADAGLAQITLPARAFLYQFILPNFYFHASMVYAVLRARGVALGKADFDGFHVYADGAA